MQIQIKFKGSAVCVVVGSGNKPGWSEGCG